MVDGENKKRKIPWAWIAAAGIGIIWLKNWNRVPLNKLPFGARVEYAMKPIQGQPSQLASVSTYRLIANRRPGMSYQPVTEEAEDRTLAFTMPPTGGTVTRNVVVEGSSKYVEVASA